MIRSDAVTPGRITAADSVQSSRVQEEWVGVGLAQTFLMVRYKNQHICYKI